MDWGQAARQFAAETGTQTILCAVCVSNGGILTPPAQVVILGGTSYCLPHSNLVKLGPVT